MRFQLNGKYEYCPNGNYWSEVSGIFDKRIYLYCNCRLCKGQIYELRPYKIKTTKEHIQKFDLREKIEKVRDSVNSENYKKVEELLNGSPNK